MEKWTPSLWLTATSFEAYQDTEGITQPAGKRLLEVSGLVPAQPLISSEKGYQTPISNSALDDENEVKVLDIGSGLGQVTNALLRSRRVSQHVRVVAGEIDDSLLAHLQHKKEQGIDGWGKVDVEKLDVKNLAKPDNTFDYIYANFLYFLLSDPLAGLKESIRVLKSGGTLSLSTWGCSGPLQLLQLAISLLPSYPLIPPSPPPGGAWSHPRYIQQILTDHGLVDIQIEPYEFVQTADSPGDMARKMHPVVPILTAKWGEERQELGWKVFEKVEELLRREQGEGPVKIWSVALVVTAKKPNE
ncbi:hypothetical protein I203_104706 [Kwoniella mangroviensis CBS 8507]|uniref:uncharacterized protein n=1 Tax=Kwoniella mangroviensis CBS 8507 TaxID=1296122 RepID=UPI00080D7099|nr:uncharacterized protein I203_00349 [Kwoniella mangroviensis CBS 8507]OCF70217.1 hypothetical protein I203_00349 [Kwoniella mangroviensis CBS 8507]